MSKPGENEPRKLAAYTKGYAAGFSNVDPDQNPWKGKHGNWSRGFEDAWVDGWNDGWQAGKMVRRKGGAS